MKLALLGCTPTTLSLWPAFGSAGFVVSDAFDVQDAVALQACSPGVRIRMDWESLLDGTEFDAVLVAGPIFSTELGAEAWERRTDQLRKLVQASVPLLVIPPVCEAIVGFELEMIRRDSNGILFTFSPEYYWALNSCPHVDDQIPEQFIVERTLPSRSRGEVLAAFVRDVEAIKRYVGTLNRISATCGLQRNDDKKGKPDLANLSVTIAGQSGLSVRWNLMPGTEHSTRWICYRNSQSQSWLLEQADEQTAIETALAHFRHAVRREPYTAPSWLDGCRSVEAMEAIDRSLERGRTIELYNEEISEQASFKGTMAVWGCLLLMIALAVFMLIGIFAMVFAPDQSAPQGRSWLWLQICFLVPFAVFLLLQLLSFGLPEYERRKRENLGSAAGANDTEKPSK